MPCNVMPPKYLALVAAAAIAIGPSVTMAQSGQVTQAGAPVAKPPAGTTGIRLGAPSASYVAARLLAAEIDDDRAVTREHEGRKIRFIPARVSPDRGEAAQGHVLGTLETELEGGETGLPPGRYTIFAKSVGGEWEAFAEADRSIAKQALRVTADDVEPPEDWDGRVKPKFSVTEEGGWCWTTGPYPVPTAWARYDLRGYWHYYPTAWGRHQSLTVCW
jgi:hypothetical protein